MLEKNTVRTMGIVMIIVANVFFVFSLLFSNYSEGRVYSDTHTGVLIVYSSQERFSESEYRGLFSGMGIDSFFLRDDFGLTSDDIEAHIMQIAQDEDLESVILMVHDSIAPSALNLSPDIDVLRGVILFFPESADAEMSHFVVSTDYDYITGVFGVRNNETISLYERLSGEDASMTPPLSGGRFLTPEIRISPDAHVYFCVAEYTGNDDLDKFILSSTPHLRQRLTVFVQDYLMRDDDRIVDARGTILFQYASEILPITVLVAGLLFFLSTTHSSRVDKGVKPKDLNREAQKPDQIALHAKIGRSEKYLFGFLLPLALAWTIVMIIVLLTNVQLLQYVIVGWTLFSVLMAAFFYLKHLKRLGTMPKPNPKRVRVSVLIAFLVVLGVFFHVITHISSWRRFLSWPSNVIILLLALFFVLGLTVCHKIDMYYTYSERNAFHRMGFLSAWRFRGLVLMPFVFLLIASFLTANAWMFVIIVFYVASLLIADIFRQKIKRVSGASALPAFVGALLYVILILV